VQNNGPGKKNVSKTHGGKKDWINYDRRSFLKKWRLKKRLNDRNKEIKHGSIENKINCHADHPGLDRSPVLAIISLWAGPLKSPVRTKKIDNTQNK